MTWIALIAVIGILLLQVTGSIPKGSVGGSMVIGFAFIVAAVAVGIHEAWTHRRGVLGWIVSIVVAFVGALIGAQLGGLVMVATFGLLGRLMLIDRGGSSLATMGSPLTEIALAALMAFTLLGSWGALRIVSRWR